MAVKKGPVEIEGILLDSSDMGTDALAARSLFPGASLHARFTLPNSTTKFEVLAEVAWANPDGETGVRFTAMPDNVRAALRLWLRGKLAGDSKTADGAGGDRESQADRPEAWGDATWKRRRHCRNILQ